MAKTASNSVGCLTLILILGLAGGCMKLFGYQSDSEKAAEAAEAIRITGLPNLVGKTLVEAENVIQTMDLRFDDQGIGVVSSCDDKTDCVVFRMSPKPGAVVERYGAVAVTWTTGEERAWYGKWKKMPKVIGWSEKKAERFFAPVAEAVDEENAESKKVPYGKNQVIAQTPKPGRPLKLGQKIRLVIGYNFDDGSSSTGNGNTDVGVNVGDGRNRGESRFCRGKWWC